YADAVCAGLLSNRAQSVLQQLVRSSFLRHRVQSMSERFQLSAREMLRRMQGFSRSLPLGYVPQNHREDQLSTEIQLRNRGFRRKLLAILTPPKKLPSLSHRSSSFAGLGECLNVAAVCLNKSLRQKQVQWFSNNFVCCVPKYLLRTLIE